MSLPNNPTVTVNFEGLMLLAFQEGLAAERKGHCQIALLQPDERHCLKVTGTMASGQPIVLPENIAGDLLLEVPGRQGAGVSVHEGVPNDPEDHSNDFKLLIDLQSENWHKEKLLQVKPGKIRQSMFILHGLFYTAEKQMVRVFQGGIFKREAEIARKVGCNLYLEDNEKAILRFGACDRDKIEFSCEPGASYTITVSTLCDPADSPDNDFRHYYDVITVDDAQFEVRGHADNPGQPTFGGSGRVPCDPVCLGRTRSAELGATIGRQSQAVRASLEIR